MSRSARLTTRNSEWVPVNGDEDKERLYLSLLRLSARWDIPSGVSYAITALHGLLLPAPRRLEIARMYSIPDWVRPAVRRLLACPLGDLTDAEMNQIGIKVYSLLVQGRERMEAEMRWVAQVPPEMVKDHSWRCTDNKVCASAFKDFWWNKIGRKLLHPSVPSDYTQIPDLIQKTSNWNGLHPECKLEMERKTRETIYPLEGIIAGVAAAIVAHYAKL